MKAIVKRTGIVVSIVRYIRRDDMFVVQRTTARREMYYRSELSLFEL